MADWALAASVRVLSFASKSDEHINQLGFGKDLRSYIRVEVYLEDVFIHWNNSQLEEIIPGVSLN